MCKVIAFTNAKKLDVKKSAETIGNILLKIEQDGFGYAIQGERNVFGERCIADRFRSRLNVADVVRLPIVESRQSSFGTLDKPAGPAIFHGRTSTNDKGLLNCHPMQRESWNLIHNGVVDDHGPKYDKTTTNDSEDLLHRLIQGIDHVERELSGYYAFAAIDPTGRLHIARDSIASLFVAWCPKIQSHIFATTESLIEQVTSALKIKVGPIDKVKSDVYMIFALNELVHQQAIKPRGYDSRQAGLASLSLGRSIDRYSESERLDSIIDMTSDRYAYDRADDGPTLEDLMRELDNMDDRYTIEYDGELISVAEYRKLDEVSQAQCLIERPDGTLLDFEYCEALERRGA